MSLFCEQFKKLLSESKTVIIAAHKDPDGDTLGTMIALEEMLTGLGLEVFMYSVDGVPVIYRFLPKSEKIITHPPKKEFDLLITVDVSGLERIGEGKLKAKKIVNIDHHPDNSNFGTINCVKKAASVGEIVYDMALELGIEITQNMAIALYVSIITDTGNFKYPNTTPKTFEIAKSLCEKGANPSFIAGQIYDTRTIENLMILSATLDTIEFTDDKKIVWATITKDMIHRTGAKADDLIGIIDFLRSVKDSEVSLLFKENKNGFTKVNFRSKGKINVSKIANMMGGGGHFQAAGCEVDMPLSEAKKKIVDLIKEEIKSI